MNGVEVNDESVGEDKYVNSVEEGVAMAKMYEAAGADSVHVRIGAKYNHVSEFLADGWFLPLGAEGSTSYGQQLDFSKNGQGLLDGKHSGYGLMIDIAAKYKEALSIPVGTVTCMDPAHTPDFFVDALEAGKFDFFMMTRPLNCDQEYAKKLQEGRLDEIAPLHALPLLF